MKITETNSIKQQTQKTSYLKQIKDFFKQKQYGLKLRVLAEDVFDKTINRDGWFDYFGKSRKLPNFVCDPIEEHYYATGEVVKFSSKDEKKLKKMNPVEYLEYSTKLINEKKFTVVRRDK